MKNDRKLNNRYCAFCGEDYERELLLASQQKKDCCIECFYYAKTFHKNSDSGELFFYVKKILLYKLNRILNKDSQKNKASPKADNKLHPLSEINKAEKLRAEDRLRFGFKNEETFCFFKEYNKLE